MNSSDDTDDKERNFKKVALGELANSPGTGQPICKRVQ